MPPLPAVKLTGAPLTCAVVAPLETIAPVPVGWVSTVTLPLAASKLPVRVNVMLLLMAVVRLIFAVEPAARLIGALIMIGPLLTSPILIVPAVTVSNSVSVRLSGPPIGSVGDPR